MTLQRTLALAAVLTGMVLGTRPATLDAAGTHQCYHDPNVDPPTACTTCSNTCLGSGYVCCSIVPDIKNPG